MSTALMVYHHYACDCCDTETPAPYVVIGNPEHFCSLTCARIFYSRSVMWIWRHRKEKR